MMHFIGASRQMIFIAYQGVWLGFIASFEYAFGNDFRCYYSIIQYTNFYHFINFMAC